MGILMARKVTLLDLKKRSRERADKVGSGFIQDSELVSYINSSACELYDLLVSAYGDDYFMNSYSFQTVGQTESYNLPSDFYKLLGLDQKIGQEYLTLKPYQFNERNKYRLGTYWNALSGVGGPRYKLSADKISFLPVPDGQYNITLHYVPVCPLLVGDSDLFDGVNGWEEYIVIDAAIKMLQKEDSDCSLLVVQKQKIESRIENMKENRDAGQSFRVTDVTGSQDFEVE